MAVLFFAINFYILIIIITNHGKRENCNLSKDIIQGYTNKIIDIKAKRRPLSPREGESENLRSFKQMQWNYIYYAILVFGGLIGVYEVLSENAKIKLILTIVVYLISIVAMDIGIYLILDIQYQMKRERISRLIYDEILFGFAYCWKDIDEEKKKQKMKLVNSWLIFITIIGAMTIGFLSVYFVLSIPH